MPGMDGLFQALADPTRRDILKMLKKRSLTPGEIFPKFRITKPSLSHHLDILMRAGLVVRERHGQNLVYSLNATVLEEAATSIMELFNVRRKED